MKVYLIGAGPGDPGLFTLKGRAILSKADVVVYDYLANETLLQFARPDAELIYAGKKGGNHTLTQDAINDLIIEKARAGKIVVRLKGGDPYMFGRGAEEAEELLKAGIAFETIPGVSSAIAAPAYAGIPLTHRQYASSVCFVTGHEDAGKTQSAHNWQALASGDHTLVFFMGMKNLADISKNLIANGMRPDMPAALIQWGTTTRHRSLCSTLKELPEQARLKSFSAPALIVIGQVTSLHDTLNWFERRPLYGKCIVVTRAREQASASAALFEELGAEVIQFPTIEISPLQDYSHVHHAIQNLYNYNWLIFTSVNGVRYFWQGLRALQKDARDLAPCKIAAIGPATAQALQKYGLEADFIPDTYVAESVAEGLKTLGINGKRILLPRAKEAREVLPEILAAAGATIDVLPVYETRPCSSRKEEVLERLKHNSLHCITFGSSSTVANFFRLISPEQLRCFPSVKLACIGPVSAETLKSYGCKCDIQAQEYTIPGLAQAVTHFFSAESA